MRVDLRDARDAPPSGVGLEASKPSQVTTTSTSCREQTPPSLAGKALSRGRRKDSRRGARNRPALLPSDCTGLATSPRASVTRSQPRSSMSKRRRDRAPGTISDRESRHDHGPTGQRRHAVELRGRRTRRLISASDAARSISCRLCRWPCRHGTASSRAAFSAPARCAAERITPVASASHADAEHHRRDADRPASARPRLPPRAIGSTKEVPRRPPRASHPRDAASQAGHQRARPGPLAGPPECFVDRDA